MTFDEFMLIKPALAYALRMSFGHCSIDGVFQDESGRWEAHLAVPPDGTFEVVREARCKPSCRRGSGGRFTWVIESHMCCEACEIDPNHRYRTVHE